MRFFQLILVNLQLNRCCMNCNITINNITFQSPLDGQDGADDSHVDLSILLRDDLIYL